MQHRETIIGGIRRPGPEVFAETLFFVQAAVLGDPALAGSRVAGKFSGFPETSVMNHRDCRDRQPFSLGAILKIWADPESDVLHCLRCGSRRLFLGGSAGGLCNMHYFADWHCPFCRETSPGRFQDGCRVQTDRKTWKPARNAVLRAAEADAGTPAGMPFRDALAKLRALRDADLLDPDHPLEAASLAAAGVAAPVLTGHRGSDVAGACLRREHATPEALAAALETKARIVAERTARSAAARATLDALRGKPGEAGPKTRFKRGELTLDEYRAIKAEIKAAAAEIDDGASMLRIQGEMIRAAEAALGRRIPAAARDVFLAMADENTWPL